VPRVYVDANVPAGVVGYMRRKLGWDVFFVMEHEDLRRAADEAHYQMFRQLHRTLTQWTVIFSMSVVSLLPRVEA
tara:strand:- start:975 stop:1199 length:225 start_codon:yes stop_codon:yes gene_type:complete